MVKLPLGQGETYEEIQNPSTHYAFQISETNYLIDCDEGKYTALSINTRSINGNLVKSVQMPDFIQKDLTDIPPASLISAEVSLACAQAKKNWPSEEYELNIKQKRVSEIAPLTSQQKEKINQAIAQQKESDKRNTPFAEPMLTAQGGRNKCHKMNGVEGNPSPYELCYAQGMFSQSIYSVRANGIPILQEIDDNVTKGIDGTFNGSPIRLQCKPVHQLADDVTNKTIEDFILLNRASSKKFSFDDELKFAISINVIEIGRHCTLSNTDGVIAKLDVASP
ncbi:hypothetical protein OJJOAM_003179 [Cupriavidus sp. H18C1]|uniref:hypothetical protein n=1 Tax=Cupriavidus sp. H18C1 TaxID=3241601 RepID=UPI003BB8E3F6